MKRKTFLKTSAVLLGGSILAPLSACQNTQEKTEKVKNTVKIRKNWAGNYHYQAENLYIPRTVEEAQAFVKKLPKQKALGSCHCFNDIADSPTNQISALGLNKVLEINEKDQTITVESGIRYGQFAPELHQKGWALHNLASLPHISVAGACATATHGSGLKNGSLATAVSALELITAEGDLVQLSREKDGEKFKGAVVNLGALGFVSKMTLEIQKTYSVRQDLFQDLPLNSLKEHFEEIMSSGYSVSLFSDWQNQKISQIWIKRRLDNDVKDLGKEFFGAKAAQKNLHPITALSAENCTEQMGVAGAWHERLPHFKMGFMPSSGEELQSEYFVPIENAVEAILALEKKGKEIFPQLLISEIRTIAADDLWMSPFYKQTCVAIHFTWKQNWEEVKKLLPMIERELAPFKARPHWGKLFTIQASTLQTHYEKLPDFIALAQEFDPTGKFRNFYLEKNIFGKKSS